MLITKKLIRQYNSLSLLKKSILWYTFASLLQKGISFIVTPIYTRMLLDTEYGLYSVYQSWSQIFSIIVIIALDRCITVGFAKFDKNHKEFLSSIQFLMTIISIVWGLLIFILKNYITRLINLPLYIIMCMVIMALLTNSLANWTWYQRYENHYKKIALVTVIFTFIIQGGTLLGILCFSDRNKGEVLIISSFSITVVCYGIIYATVFAKGKLLINKKYWSFAVPYSVAIIPHALAQIVLSSSDRIMIDKFCNRGDAAYYSVTYNAAVILNLVTANINGALQPWYFEKIKEGDYKNIRIKTNHFLALIAVMSGGITLFAPEILGILAPSSYKSAIWIFPSVSTSCFFYCIFLCFSNFESYYEKPAYFSVATITGAIVNIVLNYIFIPKFGFIAAGYTTFVCYIIYAYMHYIFMMKTCKENIGNIKVFDIKYILKLTSILIIFTFIITLTYNNTIIRYILIILGSVIGILKKHFIKSLIFN